MLLLKLRTLWIKMVYGKYSYAYANFFRKKNLKSDVIPTLKDHYLTHFYPFYRRIKDSVLMKTQGQIQFGETPFGSSYKASPKSHVEPDSYSVYKIGKNMLEVYGYRGTSFGAKHKEVLFFLDQQFVLGEYSLSKSEKAHQPDHDKLLLELVNRYQIPLGERRGNFYIEDPADSLLYFDDKGFSLELAYFNPSIGNITNLMEKWFEEPKIKDEAPPSEDSLRL